jgi:hypothetical protein
MVDAFRSPARMICGRVIVLWEHEVFVWGILLLPYLVVFQDAIDAIRRRKRKTT